VHDCNNEDPAGLAEVDDSIVVEDQFADVGSVGLGHEPTKLGKGFEFLDGE